MDLINERVKRKIGCPGTAKGFIYRLLQLGPPLVAIFSLLKDHHRDLFHFSCFKLLLTALCFQTVCSLSLCIRDAYAYKREMSLLSPIRVGCYIYWDFVAYVVVSAGAAASAAVGSLFSPKNIACLPYAQRRRKGYPSCESYMLPVVISYLGLIPIAMTGIGNIHVLKLIWTPERESPVMSRKEIVLKVAAPVIVLGVLSWACFSWIPKFIFNHVCPDCYLSTSPAPSQLMGT